MRSHKPHKGSYLNEIKRVFPNKTLNEILRYSGSTEEQAKYALSLFKQTREMINSDEYNVCHETQSSRFLETILQLNYIKKSPTDIVLDRSVKDYLESIPLKEEIKIPPLDKDMVWVDISSWGLTLIPDIKEKYMKDFNAEKVKGALIVKTPEIEGGWEMKWFDESEFDGSCGTRSRREKFKDKMPPYWCWVHLTNGYNINFPMMSVMSFSDFIRLNKTSYERPHQTLARDIVLMLVALEMISEGQFVKNTSVYQDPSLSGKQKIKSKGKSKGARFKQKYRQYRTTFFRHKESDTKSQGSRNYTPPEHYTPRNIPSHFKERWVTIDYVEKHNIPDDDIIDIEDRTKSYKSGVATKGWVKIKLWFEFTQDPDLVPKQEIERYRV